MLYIAYSTVPDHLQMEIIDTMESVAELVQEILELWLEEDGPFAILIRDEQDVVHATLFPGLTPERAVVAYRDGRLEQYDVRYLVGEDGHYTGSEVRHLTT